MAPYGSPVTIPPVYVPPSINILPGTDNTECNYLVFIFIIGVFMLSLVKHKA